MLVVGRAIGSGHLIVQLLIVTGVTAAPRLVIARLSIVHEAAMIKAFIVEHLLIKRMASSTLVGGALPSETLVFATAWASASMRVVVRHFIGHGGTGSSGERSRHVREVRVSNVHLVVVGFTFVIA